jgi:hypothetical protein
MSKMPVTKKLFQSDVYQVKPLVERWANSDGAGRGAIFTRREVVDFILDLSGYTSDEDLTQFVLLEPSFGEGDFLVPVIERLFASIKRNQTETTEAILAGCIRAVELHRVSYELTANRVIALLIDYGIEEKSARRVADTWLIQGDFLLTDFDVRGFTHVVGNPPYIRQEEVPVELMAEYRSRYKTIYDRADIYVPFYERSLDLLDAAGTLGFICANRWTKNRYGAKLRKLISQQYNLDYYIDMAGTPAFTSDVIAYPAITVISNSTKRTPTKISFRPEISSAHLSSLARSLIKGAKEIDKIVINPSEEPWFLDSSDAHSLVRRIELSFPTLEEAGCKVGIGVASGADKVFIAHASALDVEEDRMLPLVTTKDIKTGKVAWSGQVILNPFQSDGSLVALDRYPRLARYLDANSEVLKRRHVAKKNPANWYKTIDKIHPALTDKPKLLIPDIKGSAHIVYEAGGYYPHHNLYHIVSDEWDLLLLKSLLDSGIAHLFINAYSTKMHGDCLRFQAQYLRRIRIPRFADLDKDTVDGLKAAAIAADKELLVDIVSGIYSLTNKERDILLKYGNHT